VESVKAASDVYAPFSGKAVKVNDRLVSSPEIINKSAYGDGWLAVIEIKDLKEKERLLSAADYKKYIEGLSK
jgi:glycine cleavage system H protein